MLATSRTQAAEYVAFYRVVPSTNVGGRVVMSVAGRKATCPAAEGMSA
jgi:hypothetical protein